MRNKSSITGSTSNKVSLTDSEINAGFGFNTILESPKLNGQLFDIDDQVSIITKELCNFLIDNGVTPVGSNDRQLSNLLTTLLGDKQGKLIAGSNITIDENGVISATGGAPANIPLFFCAWLDSLPYNTSWVNANNNSWLYGSTYVGAYDRLLDQVSPSGSFDKGTSYYVCTFSDGQILTTSVPANSGTLTQLQEWCSSLGYTYNDASTIEDFECYKTLSVSSDVIGNITIQYYKTQDGKKIANVDQMANIESLYNNTGVAWYYIIDTTNQRFKLPRTKWGFVGARDSVGSYVPESLPNITGSFVSYSYKDNYQDSSGSFTANNREINSVGNPSSEYGSVVYDFDASLSSSTYQDNASVQQRATQMYLYFYLGSTEASTIQQIAGINADTINSKADTDASNFNTAGKSLLSGLGMPSGAYEDLTLGASGTTYTAPANGWFVAQKSSSTSGYLRLNNDNNGLGYEIRTSSASTLINSIPVKKGQTVSVTYTLDGATTYFRFIYAEGEEN